MEKLKEAIIVASIIILYVGMFVAYRTEAFIPKTFSTISGEVVEVEYVVEGTSFNSKDIVLTKIYFKDGRIAVFEGINDQVVVGRVNSISFQMHNKCKKKEITKVVVS